MSPPPIEHVSLNEHVSPSEFRADAVDDNPAPGVRTVPRTVPRRARLKAGHQQ
ncbi:hypothetical protein [Microbispora bryophytorum]|uniref:Uncharacterized protein n=1 Tax=Microbispora bryophytorum subsp. camponoti TaxID=1677852 RepID=A0ABR8KW72_9ACTN|nr:hypothetical protein [Microbispora camponoti]MBD3143017.1 hypothetical protein [Microbispora camponoti]